MAQSGHVAAPPGPTRTHAGPRWRLLGAKESGDAYWAHLYSGPKIEDGGGRTRPSGQRIAQGELSLYIGEKTM